jgi:hypothetical protein
VPDPSECPACGSTDRHTETKKVALLALSGEKLRFDLDDGSTEATICEARICRQCGFVALHESG